MSQPNAEGLWWRNEEQLWRVSKFDADTFTGFCLHPPATKTVGYELPMGRWEPCLPPPAPSAVPLVQLARNLAVALGDKAPVPTEEVVRCLNRMAQVVEHLTDESKAFHDWKRTLEDSEFELYAWVGEDPTCCSGTCIIDCKGTPLVIHESEKDKITSDKARAWLQKSVNISGFPIRLVRCVMVEELEVLTPVPATPPAVPES